MKLQRYNVWVDTDGSNAVDAESPRGEYYRATDVDALLARIRAAVDAAREADPAVNHRCDCPFGWCDGRCPTIVARAALDALLSGGQCSSLCAPGSGERCMVTDSGRCPEGDV